ncbi:malate:quinone oxidoreductase [Sphingomonas sp. Mn802worker]|uniref:malate:quinone oxidoreductase n=1 Tax=Sphingomonas sp. Mn802worker TaxID=629773 RepID=UPI003FD18568
MRARRVFVGAGGGSLPLLQKSGIPEGRLIAVPYKRRSVAKLRTDATRQRPLTPNREHVGVAKGGIYETLET